jgi:hypothetical protein
MSEFDFETDAQDTSYSVDDLKELALLAERQLALEREKSDLEAQLKSVQQQLDRVGGVDIPAAMDAIGMKDFMLKSGERITVDRKVKASIPKAKQKEAFAWLRENEHGSLIKNNVTASFGRGEDDKAVELLQKLDAAGFTVSQKEAVHAQTLGAFVREQMARGEPLPADLLGIFEYNVTKISSPK